MKLYRKKKSNIDKRGLYATKAIKAETKIISYVGKIITQKEAEKNPKFDPERPYLTKYKPDRLVLYMNKRESILWDQEMFNNPDKKIVFEACIKKPNFLDKIFK